MNFYLKFTFILFLAYFPLPGKVFSQVEKSGGKTETAAEKLNSGVQKVAEKTASFQKQVNQTGEHLKSAIENVKTIIRVFEPILQFHLRRKSNPAGGHDNQPPGIDNIQGDTVTSVSPVAAGSLDSSENQQTASSEHVSYEAMASGLEMVSDNPFYNADGTANLGSQNNSNYGCYLDVVRGRVLDDIDAATNTGNVDIIFTATDYYGSAPMYALLTPAYARNDLFANYYFRGPLYKDANIPVRQWDRVNESEIALTQLTGTQFDKIQDNNQLMAVVKQIPGFREKFESRTKLEGKVFAVKTEMGDRTVYGLLHVVNHYGTTGSTGYLKIRLKVTGIDSDGDGLPDRMNYQQN